MNERDRVSTRRRRTAPLWSRHRGAGRTTRMLEHAAALLRQGRDVLIVCRVNQVQGMVELLLPMLPAGSSWDGHKVRVLPGASVAFYTDLYGSLPGPTRRLWSRGEIHGGSEAILIDHHVIEQELGYALDQWLLWCEPELEAGQKILDVIYPKTGRDS